MLALFPMENYRWVKKRWTPLFLWTADQRKLKVAWVIGLSKEIFLMLTSNSSPPQSEEELKTTPSSSTVPELSSILYSSSSRSSIVTWHNIFTVMSCILEKISYFSLESYNTTTAWSPWHSEWPTPLRKTPQSSFRVLFVRVDVCGTSWPARCSWQSLSSSWPSLPWWDCQLRLPSHWKWLAWWSPCLVFNGLKQQAPFKWCPCCL